MKNLVLFLCLLALTISLLSSCGSLRTSSINKRDDINLEHDQLNLESHDLSNQRQQLNLEVDKQSWTIQEKSYGPKSPAAGMMTGIAVNEYLQRNVWYFIPGTLGADPILDQVVGPGQTLSVELPIGQYTVIYYEDGIDGFSERGRIRLTVTSKKNKGWYGANHYFVLHKPIATPR